MKRVIHRLADHLYVMATASREDGNHYWQMRRQPTKAVRQPPVPVKTARLFTAWAAEAPSAVVFGSTRSALALIDAGCKVTLIESDPGRAFGAEFHSAAEQRGLLTTKVIDRGSSAGREEYAHAYRGVAGGPTLVVVGGRNRTAVVRDVIAHAPHGSTVVVIGGGRNRYRQMRDMLHQETMNFDLHVGPSADGSARRTTAVIITV